MMSYVFYVQNGILLLLGLEIPLTIAWLVSK